jgi:hypothetical protein
VGITQTGYELSQDGKAEVINETDAFGESTIDLVYRGGDVYIGFDSRAYKTGAITPFWPWAALGLMGIIARLASDIASSMLLTATTGTPAFTNGPKTLTGSKTLLAPNMSQKLLFNSKLRNVPNRLLVLPVDTGGGVIGWFSTS